MLQIAALGLDQGLLELLRKLLGLVLFRRRHRRLFDRFGCGFQALLQVFLGLKLFFEFGKELLVLDRAVGELLQEPVHVGVLGGLPERLEPRFQALLGGTVVLDGAPDRLDALRARLGDLFGLGDLLVGEAKFELDFLDGVKREGALDAPGQVLKEVEGARGQEGRLSHPEVLGGNGFFLEDGLGRGNLLGLGGQERSGREESGQRDADEEFRHRNDS